jgi:hypothetical protein
MPYSSCQIGPSDPIHPQVRKCLEGRRISFIGDSITRYQVEMVMFLAGLGVFSKSDGQQVSYGFRALPQHGSQGSCSGRAARTQQVGASTGVKIVD